MKVGLIQAFNPKHYRVKPQPSLAFGYLISYIRKYLGFEDFFVTDDPERLMAEKPDIVGISSYTMYFQIASSIARKAKEELGVPVIVGGHHITALPHRLPDSFDIGVLGEGEETLRELLEIYLKEGSFQPDSLEKVRGIVFRRNGEKIVTPMRELIRPLDRIPPPEREIFDWGEYFYLLTSRGCPYRCVFCSPALHWKTFRSFSPEYVVREVREAYERYGQDLVTFNDDLFIADLKRLSRVVDLLSESGLNEKVSFNFSARANLVTDRLMEILSRMQVLILSMGLESGSDRILKYLKSGPISVEDNQRACDLCHRSGIKVEASFIVLSPPEEREDLLKTFDFIFRNRDVFYSVKTLPLTPLPGTPIWEYAMKKGIVSEEMDWNLIQQGRINLNEKITRYELYRFLQEFRQMMRRYQLDDEALDLLFPLTATILGDEDPEIRDLWRD